MGDRGGGPTGERSGNARKRAAGPGGRRGDRSPVAPRSRASRTRRRRALAAGRAAVSAIVLAICAAGLAAPRSAGAAPPLAAAADAVALAQPFPLAQRIAAGFADARPAEDRGGSSAMPSGLTASPAPSTVRIPALIAILALVLGLTAAFGRFWCAALCPLGALQDGFIAVRGIGAKAFGALGAARRGRKRRATAPRPAHSASGDAHTESHIALTDPRGVSKKSRDTQYGSHNSPIESRSGRTKFAYRPGRAWIHAAAFFVVITAWAAGATLPLGLLEPWAAFGKVAAGIARPLADLAANGAAALARTFGTYAVAFVPVSWEWPRGLAGVFVLLLVGGLAMSRGRLFCNLLCPSGALFRILSRRPRFGLRIESVSCNACGACESACRCSCIQPEERGIEEDRCVRCFDCVKACPTGAIGFGPRESRVLERAGVGANAASDTAAMEVEDSGGKVEDSGAGIEDSGAGIGSTRNLAIDRKTFITGLASVGAGAALGFAGLRRAPAARMAGRTRIPAAPPGALDADRFLAACTSCGVCAAVCPSGVIVPSAFQWGPLDLAKPYLAYQKAYCQFECDLCLRSCPTSALRPLPLEEKKRARLGRSLLELPLCIVLSKGTRCGACAEHCPTGAVAMAPPAGGGLPIPVIEESLCVGCGACETVCPSLPLKSIWVEGRRVQDRARVLEARPGDRGDVQGGPIAAGGEPGPQAPSKGSASEDGASGGPGPAARGTGGPGVDGRTGGPGRSGDFPF